MGLHKRERRVLVPASMQPLYSHAVDALWATSSTPSAHARWYCQDVMDLVPV
jgi:hypothetical protein